MLGGLGSCATSVATDDASSNTGNKVDAGAKLKEKVHTANGGLGIWTSHCNIHEEAASQ